MKTLTQEFKKCLDKIAEINKKSRNGSKLKSITCYLLEIAEAEGY
jgi:hypothetical protein